MIISSLIYRISLKLFESEDLANNHVKERLEFLKSQDKEIFRLLREMEYVQNERCENDLKFSIFDRLVYFNEKAEQCKWESKYDALKDCYDRLIQTIMTGYINVGANTFRKENVNRLEWNMYGENNRQYINVVFNDGKVAKIEKEEDLDLLKILFGENKSRRIYVNNDKNYNGPC